MSFPFEIENNKLLKNTSKIKAIIFNKDLVSTLITSMDV